MHLYRFFSAKYKTAKGKTKAKKHLGFFAVFENQNITELH